MESYHRGVERMKTENEVKRITKAYDHMLNSATTKARWSQKNIGNQAILEERRQVSKHLFESLAVFPLASKKILDIGCGAGSELAHLLDWGANSDNLYGIDLLSNRIATAKQQFPDIQFQCTNAEQLEFPDNYFDLISLFTVFSSILDHHMAQNITHEITRVLHSGGAILWYDFRYDNPRNSHTKKMTRQHIQQLFPDFHLNLQTVTLVPMLARRLGRLTPSLYFPLAKIPFLRTHYLGLLLKS